MTSYLKSKLRSIFDVQAAAALRSISQLETLVEAFVVMLLVLLCVYILMTVMSSTEYFSYLGVNFGGQNLVSAVIFLAMPSMSLAFMIIADRIRKSTLLDIGFIYHKAMPAIFGSAVFLSLALFVPQIRNIVRGIGEPFFATACLAAISLLPMIAYRRIVKLNIQAEEAMPSFIRDTYESRKTGMSPEKSLVKGAIRKDSSLFSKLLRKIADQIEWGISLKKIFGDLKSQIRSWPVLANFFILIETMEVGGGSTEALELLADYSEKMRDIEKNKRDMLKPYVILPFIWSVLMMVTFTFTFFVMAQIPTVIDAGTKPISVEPQLNILISAIIFHCWLSGFFIGKVTSGTFASGFEYSLLLAIVALVSFLFSRNLITVFLGLF